MSDTNLHILNGRLCDTPKFRTLSNNQVSVSLRIATTANFKDKNGEWTKRDEFHNVTTFITQANLPYWQLRCQKGKRMQVTGECRTEKVIHPDNSVTYYNFTAARSTDCTLPELVQETAVQPAAQPMVDNRAPAPLYANAGSQVNELDEPTFEVFCQFNT